MHLDKFEMCGLTEVEAKAVDGVRIKEASGYLECEVINEVDAGDHIIFVGKVLNSEEKSDGKRLFQKGRSFTTTKD